MGLGGGSRSRRLADPFPDRPDPDDHNNPEDTPGRRVRRQTADLVNMFRVARAALPQPQYQLLMEDDFLACPGALARIYSLIDIVRACLGLRRSRG